jgi:hypothetical protein
LFVAACNSSGIFRNRSELKHCKQKSYHPKSEDGKFEGKVKKLIDGIFLLIKAEVE